MFIRHAIIVISSLRLSYNVGEKTLLVTYSTFYHHLKNVTHHLVAKINVSTLLKWSALNLKWYSPSVFHIVLIPVKYFGMSFSNSVSVSSNCSKIPITKYDFILVTCLFFVLECLYMCMHINKIEFYVSLDQSIGSQL